MSECMACTREEIMEARGPAAAAGIADTHHTCGKAAPNDTGCLKRRLIPTSTKPKAMSVDEAMEEHEKTFDLCLTLAGEADLRAILEAVQRGGISMPCICCGHHLLKDTP